jgi:predicted Zn-dependent protease
MMKYAQNDAELAGVLAHEITHAARHHTAKMIQKAMPEQLLVELLTQRSSASVQQAATIALQVRETRWSREDEYEADQYGTRYAYRAGYPATGLRDVLQRLHSDQGDPARITWVLMDHPALSQRMARLDSYIATLPPR